MLRRITAALASILALGSCLQREPAGLGVRAVPTTLLITADLFGSPVGTVVVEVTAPDIPTPLAFNIPAVNGVASGTITVPAGANRSIALRAYDAGGVVTDTGSATLNIQPGTNPTISILLTPVAGGGIRPGTVYGETDDVSYNIVKDPVHIRDFHATILHLLGFDHQRFTYRHQGLDHRLTGVTDPARVIKELLA